MNKQGQTLGIAILTGIFFLVIGFGVINILFDEITNFRVAMNCASASEISDATKMVCLIGDLGIPLYIYAIFALVIGGILTYLAIG